MMLTLLVHFRVDFSRCLLKRRPLSTRTPRNLYSVVVLIGSLFKVRLGFQEMSPVLVDIIIVLVLSTLIDIFHLTAHASILSTSVCIRCAVSILSLLPWTQIAVSSANKLAMVRGWRSESISLMRKDQEKERGNGGTYGRPSLR